MQFERTINRSLIRAVLTHRAVWDHISDDGCGTAADFQVADNPALWYVRVSQGDELLGLFLLAPQNHVTYEIHTALLPNARGRAAEAARGVFDWFFNTHPHCRRIVTNIPESNRLALSLARRAGMQQYGLNEKSFLKRGALLDQFLFGVSK